MWKYFQTNAQDYEVQKIECSFGEVSVENNRRINQILSARLTKPEGFQGSPIFADDRSINPETDPICSIRNDPKDKNKLTYQLLISDLEKCGVLVKNVRNTYNLRQLYQTFGTKRTLY